MGSILVSYLTILKKDNSLELGVSVTKCRFLLLFGNFVLVYVVQVSFLEQETYVKVLGENFGPVPESL